MQLHSGHGLTTSLARRQAFLRQLDVVHGGPCQETTAERPWHPHRWTLRLQATQAKLSTTCLCTLLLPQRRLRHRQKHTHTHAHAWRKAAEEPRKSSWMRNQGVHLCYFCGNQWQKTPSHSIQLHENMKIVNRKTFRLQTVKAR